MENKCKKMSNKKSKHTKPCIVGTEENRKREFCRSLQGYKNCKESHRYRKQRDNQRTRKNKFLNGRKKLKERRKHEETTNRTCGQRMKKGGNEEVKETFFKVKFSKNVFWMGKVKR